MAAMSEVVVVAADDAIAHTENIAAQLALPLLSAGEALPKDCMAYLSYANQCLQLFPADAKQSGPVCVDFTNHTAAYRLQSGGELIVKAVKGRSKNPLRVLDATAGLGRDSFVLAAHGFDVTLIERNAVIAALLNDGLQRAAQSPMAAIAARMQLMHSDAFAYLAGLRAEQQPDVIYLDPMFAHNEKAALVKKEMRLFRQLLGADPCDEAALLARAKASARMRVVVKRALKARNFAGCEPAYSLAGKAIRFDIYPS